ncbi:DUF3619 family protein [Corticibacter populi]|uniref:DUF3619 family protein n=1 Tax=Corticibacter populi TaxID=1550736 RepID=A0A3M6QXD8_9BURK|nr:DUF3619 family protein [Corticibacter populi]RMX07663.1 DUF3619 family protein [Corticibacter populi]RZS30168.1 uncharacterized protein DUF3619 [Corticibacter populi]
MTNTSNDWTTDARSEIETERLGRALASQLRQGEAALGHDITARLRAARMQALEAHRKALATQPADQAIASSPSRSVWWKRLLAAVPIAAAGAGAIFMQGAVSDDGAAEIVDVDVKLLSGDVPPQAFADPAFLEYLKNRAQAPAAKAPAAATQQP